MKTSKKDMVRLLCIILVIALIPLLLVIAAMNTTEKYVARPGVFYNDSFYSWDKKAGEFTGAIRHPDPRWDHRHSVGNNRSML